APPYCPAPHGAAQAAEADLPITESSAALNGIEHCATFGSAALRQHVLYPRPPSAGRSKVHASAKSATKTLKPVFDHCHASKGLAIEGSISLGHERCDRETKRGNARKLRTETDELVDVGIGFARKPHHHVKLETVEAMPPHELSRAYEV